VEAKKQSDRVLSGKEDNILGNDPQEDERVDVVVANVVKVGKVLVEP
jgi:hypothetical protein